MAKKKEIIGDEPTAKQIKGIEKRAAEIQAGWSEGERNRRSAKPRKRWRPPIYKEKALF